MAHHLLGYGYNQHIGLEDPLKTVDVHEIWYDFHNSNRTKSRMKHKFNDHSSIKT